MRPEELTITPSEPVQQGEQLLQLNGPLTIRTVFGFQGTVRAETAPIVILDFGEVPYVDSAGIGAIVNAHVSFTNAKRRLALVGVSERVRTVMQHAKVDTILSLYATLTDARAGLAQK